MFKIFHFEFKATPLAFHVAKIVAPGKGFALFTKHFKFVVAV